MILTGIFLSISAMTKLFAVVPVLFTGIFLLYFQMKMPRDRWVIFHLIVLAISTLLSTLFLLSVFGFGRTLDGILLDSIDRPSMGLTERMTTLLYVLGTMSFPLVFFVLSIRNMWKDERNRAMIFISVPLLLFLIVQPTIWDHYFMMYLPLVCILGGIGFSQVLDRSPIRKKGVETDGSRLEPMGLLVVISVSIFVVISGGLNAYMLLSTDENIEHRIAEDIKGITSGDDLVISGDPIIPLYADRDQPPGATNLAQVRFPELGDDVLLNITAEENVNVVILCYNLVSYKDYADFIVENFEFFRGYQRPDTVTEVEGQVQLHINTFKVYIRPEGMDEYTMKEIYFEGS